MPATTPTPPTTTPTPPAATAAIGAAGATSQTIAQVQVAGCLAYCSGGSQGQSAGQEAVTVNPVAAGTSGSSAGDTVTDAPAVTQIQVGCIQYCFDASSLSTVSAPATAALTGSASLTPPTLPTGSSTSGDPAGTEALDPLTLSDLAGVLEGFGIAADLPVLPAAALTNVTSQTSRQDQTGADGEQQSAAQASVTVQPTADPLLAELSQGTWQLQIGCLFSCHDTLQVQQAQQWSVTLLTAPTTSATVTRVALVWQLQIGCLFWCYGTVQVQSATIGAAEIVTLPPPTPATATPSGDTGPAPAPPPTGSARATISSGPEAGTINSSLPPSPIGPRAPSGVQAGPDPSIAARLTPVRSPAMRSRSAGTGGGGDADRGAPELASKALGALAPDTGLGTGVTLGRRSQTPPTLTATGWRPAARWTRPAAGLAPLVPTISLVGPPSRPGGGLLLLLGVAALLGGWLVAFRHSWRTRE